jgi:ferric-dicitrate binding protein FerR (iron transport regulator)
MSSQEEAIQDDRLMFLVERALRDDTPSPDVEAAFQACRRRVEAQETVKAGNKTREIARKVAETNEDGTATASPSRWLAVGKVALALAASLLLLFTLVPKGWLHNDSRPAQIITAKKMTTIDDAHQQGGVSLVAGDKTLSTASARDRGITVLPDNIIKVERSAQRDDETYTLHVAEGKTAQLILPDGTHVWLSVGSEIAFNSHFGEGAPRRVALRGEAFFNVHHDAASPFTVDAGDCHTTVYGTRFNVRNIEGDAPQVTLVSGKVGVSYHSKTVMLSPGHQAVLDNGDLMTQEADMDVALSWKEGHFYFDGQTLQEIVDEIGRWYGMPVSYMSDADIYTRLHFNAERSWPVTRVIDELNKISHTKVEIHDNRLRID